MKYALTQGNRITEFATIEAAQMYANSVGAAIENISQISDDPTPILTGYDQYSAGLEVGYPIANTPYILGLGDVDRAQFSGMLILVNEALELGLIGMDTMQTISDRNGNAINMTSIAFKQLMIGYGFHYKTLWDMKSN